MIGSSLQALARFAPRSVRERVASLRRDVAMVRAGLSGQKPPPFAARKVAVAPLAGRAVRIARVVRETDDAVSLVLEDPAGAPFEFSAGQFLTLLVELGGETLRRAYSISSSPDERAQVTVTVKRVPGGLVSNHLVSRARAGDRLAVLGPSGSFTLTPEPESARHIVLLAGGSGITPLMCIAQTALAKEPKSRVSLIYGSRSHADVIFAGALDALAREHAPRLTVRHVLGQVLDRAAAERELAALELAPGVPTWYYVCGPEPMMQEARAALLARAVDPEAIREERFTQPHLRKAAPEPAAPGAQVTIRVKGRDHEVAVARGQTLLEAGLAAGVAMPFSCAMGGCGACMVHVSEGAVDMDEPNCLTDEERARGTALACIGRPCAGTRVEVRS